MTTKLFAFIAVLLTAGPSFAQQYASSASAGSMADYVIGAHDVLVITSYDDKDLSGKFTVETDGTFTFPMLGRIKAAGKTLRDTEASLEASLVERGLFIDPDLTVSVDQYRSYWGFSAGQMGR